MRDHPLKGCPLAVLDTETTGLDTATARIVDIAVVHCTIGGPAPEVAFSSLVNPGEHIPPDSTRITGIDDEMVKDAPRLQDIGAQVRAQCVGRLIVAYNAPYDYGIILAEGDRLGWSQDWAWPWLDLLVVRRAASKFGKKKLAEVAAEHGIALDAHGAAGDALTTAMLATPLLRAAWSFYRNEGGDSTVGHLLDWQSAAALEQERDFAAWCRRQGHAQPPRCDWHRLLGVDPPSWEAPVKHRITKDGRAA